MNCDLESAPDETGNISVTLDYIPLHEARHALLPHMSKFTDEDQRWLYCEVVRWDGPPDLSMVERLMSLAVQAGIAPARMEIT